jgi:pyruvate dehydrogenase E1 component
MIPEALAAATQLWQEGVAVDVINIVSARALYERYSRARRNGDNDPLAWLFADEQRRVPMVTVHDAASHALAWLGSVYGAPLTSLGVDDFGQSGSRDALYQHFHIDTTSIVAAVFDALDGHDC